MGLLDQMFAQPDSAQAMGLLGAYMAAGKGPEGFAQAIGLLGGSKDRELERQYKSMQVQNLTSEIENRKAQLAKQAEMQKLLSGAFGSPAAPPSMPGQLGSGSFGITPPPTGQPSIPQMPQSGGGSRIGSMNPDMLAMLKANGLDLVDVAKLARPDMQVSNGYAYDKNNTQPGFLPQFNMSQNGQATLAIPGAGGVPNVSAAPGAVNAFSQFQNAEQAARAKYDPIKVFNNRTKQDEYVSRDRVAGQPASSAQPGVNGSFTGDPAAIMSAIVNIKDPQERANAMAAFTEQAKRTQGFTQGANFAAGPSQADTNASAADKAYQENVAKDVVGQRKNIMDAGSMAPQNIARYQQIGKLLSNVDGGTLTPMGTHLASLANSVGLKIDKDLPNKEAAASIANQAALELRSPAGGAGMPGAMSDADRNFLVSMTPNMAQSAQGRKQIIDSYVAVQQRNQQVAQFARNYEKKYGRLDNGFFDQLSAWSNSNPLFGAK
jgi:hypothetical protein